MVNFKKIFLILFSLMLVVTIMLQNSVQAAEGSTVIAPGTPTPAVPQLTPEQIQQILAIQAAQAAQANQQ